jgi:hypothetical protein
MLEEIKEEELTPYMDMPNSASCMKKATNHTKNVKFISL